MTFYSQIPAHALTLLFIRYKVFLCKYVGPTFHCHDRGDQQAAHPQQVIHCHKPGVCNMNEGADRTCSDGWMEGRMESQARFVVMSSAVGALSVSLSLTSPGDATQSAFGRSSAAGTAVQLERSRCALRPSHSALAASRVRSLSPGAHVRRS